MSTTPDHPQRMTARPRFASTVAASAAVIVAVTIAGVLLRVLSGAHPPEIAVLQAISDAHAPWMSTIALIVNTGFDTAGASVVVVVITAAMLAITRKPRVALTFFVLAALPPLGNFILKEIVRRPRPDPELLSHPLLSQPLHSFSFPSGHTTFATALCLALLITIPWGRWLPLARVAAVVIPLFVAFTRMYIGVHYLTDVVAAMIAATAGVLLVWAVLGRMLPTVPDSSAKVDPDGRTPDRTATLEKLSPTDRDSLDH